MNNDSEKGTDYCPSASDEGSELEYSSGAEMSKESRKKYFNVYKQVQMFST